MEQYIQRESYLHQLIARRDNGEIKIITGPRRSGKSWLLNRIYKEYLISEGVPEKNIIIVSLDTDDEEEFGDLTDRHTLKSYIYNRMQSADSHYYIILDEVQEVEGFEKLVNGLNAKDNTDIYITGSNSHFLSSDIKTIFRGRGDEIRVYPFSFKEFCTDRIESISELWKEYYTYGGMPGLLKQHTPEQKVAYLQRLWNKTYLEEAFLFEGAKRYNIKGNKYYDSIKKYYAVDVGLRNAKLNFRQQEVTHIMENVIYNELRMRGFTVDVGLVEVREMRDGKLTYIQYEVDFIASNGTDKYYIQSAFAIDDEEKRQQELNSLLKIDDSFRKIVIVGNDIAEYTDDKGIRFMGLFQFLLTGLVSR